LKDKFNDLFEICEDQNKSVAWLAARGRSLRFCRWLDERAQKEICFQLVLCLLKTVTLNGGGCWEIYCELFVFTPLQLATLLESVINLVIPALC
jgi:hypothetical protein